MTELIDGGAIYRVYLHFDFWTPKTFGIVLQISLKTSYMCINLYSI